MPPTWRISPLTDADIDELARVHVLIWQQAYAGIMPADYLASLDPARRAQRRRSLSGERPHEQTFVAREAAGAIVGFSAFGPSRDDDPPTADELYAINLLAHVHGTGLADDLVARTIGDHACTLWVLVDNHRARRFYQRHGFIDEGGRKAHAATGTAELRMIRRRQDRLRAGAGGTPEER